MKKPKLFIERSVKDVFINAYIKDLVMAWQANHDIQYVLDVYSCVMYIGDHITKAPKGMRTLMLKVCKVARDQNMTLQHIIHNMPSKFLNAVDSPVTGVYNYILQLPITVIDQKGIYCDI